MKFLLLLLIPLHLFSQTLVFHATSYHTLEGVIQCDTSFIFKKEGNYYKEGKYYYYSKSIPMGIILTRSNKSYVIREKQLMLYDKKILFNGARIIID